MVAFIAHRLQTGLISREDFQNDRWELSERKAIRFDPIANIYAPT